MLRPYERSFGPEFVREWRARGVWRQRTVGQELEAIAARLPDALFLDDGTRSLTFEQALRAARRVAERLLERELGGGVRGHPQEVERRPFGVKSLW